MNNGLYRSDPIDRFLTRIPTVQPDFSGLDTAQDILRDAARCGLVEDLRALLNKDRPEDGKGAVATEIIRDIGYELAGAKNRDFAVDVFVHATGIAEFGAPSLRDYAKKHGCSHEWFRKEVEAMRKRLGLPTEVRAGKVVIFEGQPTPSSHA